MKESLDPKRWWKRAMQDRAAALLVCEHDPESLAEPICVCCQQACEKMLKAYPIFTGWELVRTHDLRFLAKEAERLLPAVSALLPDLVEVSLEYRASRYPFAFEEDVTEEDARRAIKTVEQLRSLLEPQLLDKIGNS